MVTKKVLGSGGALQIGVVVEVISDLDDLVQRIQNMLSRLRYDGPFEMEFIGDPASGKFCVLELNPRFWMQHGLLDVFVANGLIRRYLDLDDESDRRMQGLSGRAVWVDTTELLGRALRGDLRILKIAFDYRLSGARTLLRQVG